MLEEVEKLFEQVFEDTKRAVFRVADKLRKLYGMCEVALGDDDCAVALDHCAENVVEVRFRGRKGVCQVLEEVYARFRDEVGSDVRRYLLGVHLSSRGSVRSIAIYSGFDSRYIGMALNPQLLRKLADLLFSFAEAVDELVRQYCTRRFVEAKKELEGLLPRASELQKRLGETETMLDMLCEAERR